MRSAWTFGLVAMILSCSGAEIAPLDLGNAGKSGDSSPATGGSGGSGGSEEGRVPDAMVSVVPNQDASDAARAPETGIDPMLAARYPAGRVHAPLTEAVAKRLLSITSSHPGRDDHLATRMGDFNYKIFPETASSWWWGCLDPKSGSKIQWGSHGALQGAVDFFAQGKVDGASTFYHDAVSCIESGTTKDQLSSNSQFAPNLLEYEIKHSNARYGLVLHGLIETIYFSGFGEDVWQAELEIIDRLIAAGVIPIVMAPPMVPLLGGDPAALRMSRTVDTILRGLAEARQVPFVSRLVALQDSSPAFGVSYGPHLDTYIKGKCELGLPGPNNCDFTDAALKCGFDMSILLALEALDSVRHVVTDHAAAPDPNPGPARSGNGTAASPFEIESLPYTQMTDLSQAADHALSSYASCGGGANESGTEHVYHFKAVQNTPVRYFGINSLHNDRKLTVHHFKGTVAAGSCSDSTNSSYTGFNRPTVLAPGDHYFVVDGAPGGSKAEVLFGIVACDADDTRCK